MKNAETTKIILLNSPPGSGKDTLANYLVSANRRYCKHEFKTRLNQIVQAVYGITDDQWKKMTSRENKELTYAELRNKSSREVQIEISEKVIKPFYGNSYFSQTSANSVEDGMINVFSDSGFAVEIPVMLERFGYDNVLLARIHREGCTYSSDSRNYIYDDSVKSVDLENIYLDKFLYETEYLFSNVVFPLKSKSSKKDNILVSA